MLEEVAGAYQVVFGRLVGGVDAVVALAAVGTAVVEQVVVEVGVAMELALRNCF